MKNDTLNWLKVTSSLTKEFSQRNQTRNKGIEKTFHGIELGSENLKFFIHYLQFIYTVLLLHYYYHWKQYSKVFLG